MRAFSTRTYGKWILAGEHAVLRGCPALAFPLISRHLDLEYHPHPSHLEVEFRGSHGEDLKLLFYGVIENAISRLNVSEPLHGRFVLTNLLPVGAGLGASAALCGAVARWCENQGWVGEPGVYEFARQLENLFHGESSGVDLAVSLSGQGLCFVRDGARNPVELRWWPRFYLSYCGQRGMTSDCVGKVKRLFDADPSQATTLDQQMRRAVHLAFQALTVSAVEVEGLVPLRESMELARECFERWDLCGGDVGNHLRDLSAAGALAVKPTGSGGGGYVLSLWVQEPPAAWRGRLIPVLKPHASSISPEPPPTWVEQKDTF